MIGDVIEVEEPCETCGTPTTSTGTKRCDSCWEIEGRLAGYLARGGDKAERVLMDALEQVLDMQGIVPPDRDFGVGVPGLIAEECYRLRDMLHEKNKNYGNSTLDPLRIFSKAAPEEQIKVRLDDKLSRLMRGSAAGEDVELDIMGYLILLRIARRCK